MVLKQKTNILIRVSEIFMRMTAIDRGVERKLYLTRRQSCKLKKSKSGIQFESKERVKQEFEKKTKISIRAPEVLYLSANVDERKRERERRETS